MTKRTGFEAEVLTRLEYIKENQKKHDKMINDNQNKHDEMFKDIYTKINHSNKRLDITEGFAKGALIVGSLGFFASIGTWVRTIIGGR